VRVGVYLRISDDIEGLAKGVGRQESDCRKLAKQRGWTVAKVYSDNDISAYKARVIRPDFELMLVDLRSGTIDGVVTYDLDRFARKPTDLERAIEIYDARRGLGFATVQADIDLSTSDGRTMARVMVAFANKSSMDTSRRVKRKHLELARSGVPVGGNRPFGWKADRKTLDPKETRLIRKAVDDIFAGVGLTTIVREWNERGITTTTGGHWRPQVLRSSLRSPRVAGYRVYQGAIARDEEGNPVTGLIKPILDVETWERLVAVLTDPSRGSATAHVGGRKYLLTGIVRCGGTCGKHLFGNANRRLDRHYYTCRANDGCGEVAVSGVALDELITKLILNYLGSVELKSELSEFSGETELTDVDGRIKELMAAFTSGELSSDVVFPAISKLEGRRDVLRGEKTAWLRNHTLPPSPASVHDGWHSMDVATRRSAIGAYLEAVVIKPSAGPRGPKFDPTRVVPVWR
jgi:DNA invertase Pin-like site-specific DNA recombinase